MGFLVGLMWLKGGGNGASNVPVRFGFIGLLSFAIQYLDGEIGMGSAISAVYLPIILDNII